MINYAPTTVAHLNEIMEDSVVKIARINRPTVREKGEKISASDCITDSIAQKKNIFLILFLNHMSATDSTAVQSLSEFYLFL